jgi:hypothetical protein
MRHEFDREMVKERKAYGLAYEQGKLEDQYGNVMDYLYPSDGRPHPTSLPVTLSVTMSDACGCEA